jgi:cytidylate kinase
VSSEHPLIAIDGPAGSGKSTLSRGLAAALGLAYVNTGLMYRALAAAAVAADVPVDDAEPVTQLARGVHFTLSRAEPPELLIDGEPADEALTSEAVEAAVSHVARHPAVREVMREEQRRLGAEGAVMEGRDISTVVFPDADLKIFLVADPETRAARRVAERGGRTDLASELATRDRKDEKVNPFVAAAGAIEIDTTEGDAESVLAEALRLARERGIGAGT